MRARAKQDLERLIAPQWWAEERPAVVTTPEADYRYRVVARQAMVATRLAELALEVDYDNFKNAVAGRQSCKRATIYHDVWEALLPIQQDAAIPTHGRTKKETRPGRRHADRTTKGGTAKGRRVGATKDAKGAARPIRK